MNQESNHQNEVGDESVGASSVNKLDLCSIISDDGAKSDLLSSARQEMYDALKLFHDHVKHSLSLMFGVFTVVFAIFGFILRSGVQSSIDTVIPILGGSLLVLTFPLGIISAVVISRYYGLYVAALIYATELHESVGLDSHAWFQQIKEYRSRPGINGSLDRLLKKRTYGWPHSWILYTALISLIGVLGLVIGIFVLTGYLPIGAS